MLKISSLALLLVTATQAQSPRPPQVLAMRDAVTHQDLIPKYRAADQEDPMRNMKPMVGPDPSKANQPESLLATSDILCFGGVAVLIPKRAVLLLPSNLAERLKYKPGAPFVSWADFYAANRGWITTVEVSRVQAEGNLEIEKEAQQRISKSSNLVIATFLAGPISVLPLKVPVEKTTEKSKS